MAWNSRVASIFIFGFLLSAFTGDAHVESPPAQQVDPTFNDSASQPVSSASSGLGVHEPLDVPADEQAQTKSYLKVNMEATASMTKEFVERVILRRLNNRSTEESAEQCLTTCYEAYDTAVHAMERGIQDVSRDDYSRANQDIEEFTSNIETCTQCIGEMRVEDPEFKQFQEWAKSVAGDYQGRLKSYIH